MLDGGGCGRDNQWKDIIRATLPWQNAINNKLGFLVYLLILCQNNPGSWGCVFV